MYANYILHITDVEPVYKSPNYKMVVERYRHAVSVWLQSSASAPLTIEELLESILYSEYNGNHSSSFVDMIKSANSLLLQWLSVASQSVVVKDEFVKNLNIKYDHNIHKAVLADVVLCVLKLKLKLKASNGK
jgi:hypothetical protein